jgi:para-aminobenzoate synthetase/4-amino-4-deoxychorismate lyase
MTTAVFGLATRRSDWSVSFTSPSRIIVASHVDEIIPLLDTADAEARGGKYVALMLSYEAAPAFDSSLKTHSLSSFPLAWAAVFPASAKPPSIDSRPHISTEWKPQVSRSEYDAAVLRIRELIAMGHTYQVNYSIRLVSTFKGDVLSWYQDLSIAQGADYSAYLDLGRYKVLSISPELFFERKDNLVRTRPMKGTVRRGRWETEDNQLANWLASSEKDKAENVMIVDLLRNDLGKVSIPGSVKVSSLFELERFETVWQMTSTVESVLKPQTSLVDLMGALFPCGSITGAPKIRTMEIIRELEPYPRGAYTGTIGFLRPGGDCVFNVAIRTVVVDSTTGEATFGVGGGITIDSTAEREYEECLVKARFLQYIPQSFVLFESILLEGGKYFFLERHINRLRSSAKFFNFEFPEAKVRSSLDEIGNQHRSGKWKVRLTLGKKGAISTRVSEVEPRKDWRIALAKQAVDSNDRLLFHKTTSRDRYAKELEAAPECDDVLFFNERGELTESTKANIVLELDGKLVTPTLSSGLLAGTFRDHLIGTGEIEERVIHVGELQKATRVFLINSVRKWITTTPIGKEQVGKGASDSS